MAEFLGGLGVTLAQLSYWSALHLGDMGLESMKVRGRMQEGKVADITIFDPATVAEGSDYSTGMNGLLPKGLPHVIVNKRQGKHGTAMWLLARHRMRGEKASGLVCSLTDVALAVVRWRLACPAFPCALSITAELYSALFRLSCKMQFGDPDFIFWINAHHKM